LKTEGIDIEKLITIEPSLLNDSQADALRRWFDNHISFTHDSLFSELGASSPDEVSLDRVKPDRRELDKIIMGEILGLTDEEQLEVYRAVVDLVRSRIERAKSVAKGSRISEGVDMELFTDTIVKQVKEDSGR